MAINIGDEVATLQVLGNAEYAERNGDFQFGVAATADVDVIWANGTFALDVPAAALDKIVPDSTAGNGMGTVVRFGDSFSPEYAGIVIREYTRQAAGSGTATHYTLIQLLSTGRLVEVPRSAVTVVPGR